MTVSPNNGPGVSADAIASAGAPARVMIGLPIPTEQASWRQWSANVHLLMTAYTERLHAAEASVLMLPPPNASRPGLAGEAAALVSRLDGLVLAGGADLDPELYGADPHERSGPYDSNRDQWEMDLIAAAIDQRRPVLGICRGHQVINVACGGTLHQHLPEQVGTEIHNPTVGAFASHDVTMTPGSWLAGAIGEHDSVATYHHQALDALGRGLRATAFADDGTIEGIEDLEQLLIGVQWHPEIRGNHGIFESFVNLCRDQRDLQ